MDTLRRGATGNAVRELQGLLIAHGHNCGVRDGVFGPRTLQAVTEFQRSRGLTPDGIAGPLTMMALGAPATDDTQPVTVLKPLSMLSMQQIFGAFDWTPRPGRFKKQEVEILGDWEELNIVRVHVPLFDGVPWYDPRNSSRCNGLVRVHRLAVAPLRGAASDIIAAGLATRIRTVDGFHFARYQAGSASALSRHSWGTAFDANAYANPYGRKPAGPGTDGSVYELLEIMAKWGWAWGGPWATPDGMHFELARLPEGGPPDGETT